MRRGRVPNQNPGRIALKTHNASVRGINVGVVTLSTVTSWAALQPRESARCQSDIVSSTVVATFCGHRQGDKEVLDLLILWRGKPGWFHWKGTGRHGSAGSSSFGAGTRGVTSQSTTYGDVTIAFHANFDTSVATIGPSLSQVRVVTVCERLKKR